MFIAFHKHPSDFINSTSDKENLRLLLQAISELREIKRIEALIILSIGKIESL